MNTIKAPRSLRSNFAVKFSDDIASAGASRVTAAVAGILAAAGLSGAQAQQAPLNPVTVDAPTARPKPPAKLTADQRRARAELRRAQQRRQQDAQAAAAAQQQPAVAPDANPFANPAAPYMATRLSSPKFAEPIANQPRTITVLTKELLEDRNSTTLRDAVLSTAGVTLGAGEGGNAFGDRFFIRGFDARNDIFLDGIRDPGVSVRENFFTEQIEILRGPASSFAGRGTTGGAINIVTKQAGDKDFLKSDASIGTASSKRLTIDTNKVVNSDFSVRFGAMGQDSGTPGRAYVDDDRWGGFAAMKWQPNNDVKVTANYIHTDLDGKPDFGVPWDRNAKTPSPETYGGRDVWYGFVYRDFQKVRQDIATVSGEVKINPFMTINNRTRLERSILDYIGVLPEAPRAGTPGFVADPAGFGLTQLNPQSRFQKTNVVANQTDLTFKYNLGPWQHTTVTGTEFSNEQVSFQGYRGLSSEALPGGLSGTGAVIVPIGFPNNNTPFGGPAPALAGNPQNVTVDTKALYLIETANYNDFVILNGGIRYDDYSINSANGQGQNSVHSGIVSYNGGIVVKPTPISSVYAAYATSANPVGAELDGTTAQYGALPAFVATGTNQVFSPERNAAAEVGTKWELFNRRLLATAALFRTEKDNARELGTIGGVANTVVAGAQYHVQGIDIGLTGKITDRWSVFGGLVLMDSRVDKSNIPPANPAVVGPTNVGLKLANIAHQSFSMMSKYKFDSGWELGGTAVYNSKVYGGTYLAANQGTSIPDYWRFDAFVEKKLDKNVTLKVFANNIFDTVYYNALYQSATPFVLIAPGRSVVGMVSMKF